MDQKLEQERLERLVELTRKEVDAEQAARSSMVAEMERLRRENEALVVDNENQASQLAYDCKQKAKELALA